MAAFYFFNGEGLENRLAGRSRGPFCMSKMWISYAAVEGKPRRDDERDCGDRMRCFHVTPMDVETLTTAR